MALPTITAFAATHDDRVLFAVGDLRRRVDAIERHGGGSSLSGLSGTLIAPGTLPGGALNPATMPGTLQGDWFVFNTTLTGVRIPGDLVVDGSLAAGKITTPLAVIDFLNAGVINANLFTVDVGVANKLLSNLTVSDEVVANGLRAISASMGTLTAGKALFTGASGDQVGIGRALQYTPPGGSLTTFDGILMVDAAGNVTLRGDAADGTLQWKGACLPGSSGLGNVSGMIFGDSQIQPNSIPGDQLVIDAIGVREMDAIEITAIDLDAASGRVGKLKAGAVDAMTVTGPTIQSSAPGGGIVRTVHDSTGLYGYDSGANEMFSFKSGTGRATLIDATIRTASGYPRLEIAGGKLQLWKSSSNNGLVIDGTSGEPMIQFGNADLSSGLGNARFGRLYGDTIGSSSFQMEMRSDNGLQILNYSASSGAACSAGSFPNISDEQIKHLIEPIPDALAKIQAIRGATFFHDDGGPLRAGVIAQDVELVLPEAISSLQIPLTGMEVKTVDLAAMIGLLVAAIQDEAQQRTTLGERVDLVEAAVSAMPGGLNPPP